MGPDRRKKRAAARLEVYEQYPDNHTGQQPSIEYIPNTHYHITTSGSVRTASSFVGIPSLISPPVASASHSEDLTHTDWNDNGPLEFEFDHTQNLNQESNEEMIEVITLDTPKRKRYGSDKPLLQWIPERSVFLDEFIRLEGRGDYRNNDSNICICGSEERPVYRCQDCFSLRLLCQVCIVLLHAQVPLHRIQEWNGKFFESITLKGLGLRIQLGHDVGQTCLWPIAASGDNFVVIDCHGIHEIALDYCGCPSGLTRVSQLLRIRWFPATVREPSSAATFAVLEQFHLLSFESKVSAYEFYHSIARRTDNTGMSPLRDRYQAFMRMVREWRHIKSLKRAGRGHDPEGIESTKPGQCAVICPACPQPGMNLPDCFEDLPAVQQWLYTKFIAIDANFRLKRDDVSSDAADPSLSQGWGTFVEETGFKAHIERCAHIPQEKSSCSSHKAVDLADTKASRGLAATGVGAVDCARHNFKLPNGVGDLQKGERYANMDYLVFSALAGFTGKSLFISYDIACQWHKHLWERMSLLPPHLQFNPVGKEIRFLVPKFHLPAHVEACQTTFSFNFIKGSGRTDGEAIERGWSNFNPVASSTKAMGPGSRRDTLDDHFSDWNWKKLVGLGSSLLRKVKEAVTERREHCTALAEFEGTLDAAYLAQYKLEMEEWEADRSKRNPFHSRVDVPTQNSVKLSLAEDETRELEKGNNISLHADVSPSVLISSGLELEEQQRRLTVALAELGPHSTDIQKTKVQQSLNILQRKIDLWITVQILYMPVVAVHRAKAASISTAKVEPQKYKLWLPSELNQTDTCDVRLRENEWLLRHAQAHDALNQIRQHLRVRYHLYAFKRRNVKGQGPNTRAQGVLTGVESKIAACVKKYHNARSAVQALSKVLGKVGWEIALKELTKDDLKAMTDLVDGETEGRKRLTWIWRTPGVADCEDEGLQDAVRMEWCRARARAMRWSEEVELLQEEMRRVLQYFESHFTWWEKQGNRRFKVDSELAEGLEAYAANQAILRRSLAALFRELWLPLSALIREPYVTSLPQCTPYST
ncbi:hypothetical protein BJ138DRAFT_1138106 [Hygrophoropsis aurantiaca]|uniref:Uncharacterized protein n=1 Tax=Hygrophoropsis aurantiaca TaxID=72124 RepID=A0ACB7ZYE1_9AGAM|nr:hypothetical protein BJ138DRAFT_1138106 [Hygrophoropsis aurantiaca]